MERLYQHAADLVFSLKWEGKHDMKRFVSHPMKKRRKKKPLARK